MYLCKLLWISLWLWSHPGFPQQASLLLIQGKRDCYLLMPLPPAASCFGLQTDFILLLSPLSCFLPCSSHAKWHVLSLAWCCPDGAFSLIRHYHVSISMLSTVCRVFPTLTLPSPNQKATDRSNSPPVVARWGWPVRGRKSGKAWWGQDRLSNLCGCEEDTG